MNTGCLLWIISGHNHCGYDSTSYGGHASLSYGYDPPQYGYGEASTRMLTIAMGRLLLAMDMDMLQLSMADMFLSATDMTLLNMDIDMPLPECSMADTLLPTREYASFNLNRRSLSPYLHV